MYNKITVWLSNVCGLQPLHNSYDWKSYVLFFALLIGCYIGQAQNPKDTLMDLSLEDLMNIRVVTASKSSESIQLAPAIISTTTAKEIESYGAVTLAEVLDKLTSVYFMSTYFAPDGMIAMRSTQTDHYNTKVLILLDSRPLRESFHGGYNGVIYSMFPTERIDKIEVIRGPGSVLYGTNAYVGVINIVTKKGNDGIAGMIRYGQFNTKQANLSYGSSKKIDIATGLNFLSNDGWEFEARGESDVIRNKANTADSVFRPTKDIKRDIRGMGGVVKLGYKGLALNLFGAQNDWATMGRTPTWPSPLEYRIENQRYFGDLTYSKKISETWTSSISATYNSFFYRAHNSSKADDYLRRGSNDVLIEFTNHLRPLRNLNLVVGGLVNKQSGKGVDLTFSSSGTAANIDTAPNNDPWYTVPSYDYSWYAAYAQSDYTPIKQIKLIAGVQMNKIDGLQANYSPRFGAIFSANDNLGLKVLYGNAFRSPAAFERFGKSPASVLGSSSLTPESITTMESQLFYNTAKVSVAATYFFNHDDNNITRQNLTQTINGVTYAQLYINSGYVNVNGLEIEGKYKWNDFTVQGSGTYQSSVDNLNQKNYTGIPQVMAKLGLTYSWKKMGSLAFWNSYYGAPSDYFLHKTDGTVTTKMANAPADAYNYASVNLRVNLKEVISSFPDVAFNFGVNNVFDANVFYPELVRRNINSLPGRPSRAVYASFSIKIH